MSKFHYMALKNNSEIVKGEVEASSLRDAREKIRLLGFVPTKVYMEDTSSQALKDGVSQTSEKESQELSFLSLNDKISFTSELEVLLSSGISILEALETLEVNSPSSKIKSICTELKQKIMEGMTFSQALNSLYGNIFGPVYTSLIASGEHSGELEVTLGRMLKLLKNQDNIKGKIIRASIYPAILLLLMFGVLLLFAKVIFPAFYGVIAFSGGTIPLMAQILINLCTFVGNFWWLILIAFGAFGFVVSSLLKDEGFKSRVDKFILSIPVVSNFIKYINLSNYLTVLQISYDAGLPIMSGLELSEKTLGNLLMKKQACETTKFAKKGKSLTESFQLSQLIPGALMTMIATGEKSGTLGKMLKDAADVVEKKVDLALEALLKMFEPAIIIIMGGFVLFIAVAFYQLYASMLGSIF